jgi:hypothetical protein
VVHLEHDCSSPRWQAPVRCRLRICLLKGCEKWFSPLHPRARYCSEACRESARRWSVWQAARRYRASERGKECRRQQACRYRERVHQQRERPEEQPSVCEGHQKAEDSEKIPCLRPGCYELFLPEPRSPLKKFCSCLCREALRRVRQREVRWRWRRSSVSDEDRWERFRGPPDGFR